MPAGRPVGTVDSPAAMIKKDLKESLKQQAEIRELFADQVRKIKYALASETVTMKERLEAMAALASMSESVTKSVAQTAKWVMPASGEEAGVSEVRMEQIIKELFGKEAQNG